MLVLHLCKVSCLCRCIVQRLGSADISVLAYNFWQATKASLLGRSPKAGRRDASPRIHPRHGCRACMHKGFARTQSQPSIHSLSRVKGAFGKDAEIRTRRALHEAKPSECPKGDRDCKRAPFYKNRLLLIVVNLTTTSFFGIFPD